MSATTAGARDEVPSLMRDFGAVEFQLMLLRRMDDHQPVLVDEVVRRLGVRHRSVADAHRRWQRMLHSRTFPKGLDRYRLVLGGSPEVVHQRFGALRSQAARWPLPLWPDLRFEVVVLSDGMILQEWLVRADPSTRPRLSTVSDLAPWSCVVQDLEHGFPPVRHAEDGTASRWAVVFYADDGEGTSRRYLARFAWGLIQSVSPVEG
jgi:hypothetical protein